MRRRRTKTETDRRQGVAAIEFAMVAPLLILLMMGIIVYGGWFWMAHSVQSLASESARAAIAGLDPVERDFLARSYVSSQAAGVGLDPALASLKVESTVNVIRVDVAYQASSHPLMALAILMPKPPATINRAAVVPLGGY